MMAPLIIDSTQEERENYILETFKCKADCDNCGFCSMYRGQDAITVFKDYIEGKMEFLDIVKKYR